MLRYVLLVFLFQVVFAEMTAFTIDGKIFSDNFLYSKFGKEEWVQSSDAKKQTYLDDFLRKYVFAEEARALGLADYPDVRSKIRRTKRQILVNETYETLVADKLLNPELIASGIKNLKNEIFIKHILIGHENSKMKKPAERSEEEARTRVLEIREEFIADGNFLELADKYSDDPSVAKNHGTLGWLTWGRTIPVFQEAAFALSIGEMSPPIQTDFGFHLILVDSLRESQWAGYSSDEYEAQVKILARGSINEALKTAALEYDSTLVKEANIRFNNTAIETIANLAQEEFERSKIVGAGNIDVGRLMENNANNIGLICVVYGKGYGAKWFTHRLPLVALAKRPRLKSPDEIRFNFTSMILQFLAEEKAAELGLENTDRFKKLFFDYEIKNLYDAYRDYIGKNLPTVSDSAITAYYEENKDADFREEEKVAIRDIRVGSQELADSLYGLLKNDADFIELASIYSAHNGSAGGKVLPFSRGKYSLMGEKAFKMEPGEYSEPFQNLNKTWSIILLEDILPEGYSELTVVHNKIKTILNRQNESQAKIDAFESLKKKYKVQVNPEFFSIEDSNE